ncbi:MAG TPA: exodeoxyribonuclease VII small subunit [Flavisolibacter sp.]|jgi:exodeoxyribonuclease VII small subunit|nr:exodeoxyribonuclease VII small subunit [Flavisolibacter sp.]
MQTALSYEEAFSELKKISAEIESEAVSVDVLAEKVKRASFLIEYCQQKLRASEEEVANIIAQMEGPK